MLKFNTLFTLLFIILTTAGCNFVKSSLIGSETDSCDDTSFIIDEVKGSLSISDEKVLPEEFTLQLKTCMRSRGKIETTLPRTFWALSNYRDTLTNDKISKSANLDNKINKVIQVQTDGEGCIQWTETHDYAYSKKSQWIVINRHIKGLSNEHPGICTVPIAVNPWLQLKDRYSNIQVADYRKKYHLDNNNLKDRVIQNGLEFLKKQKEEEEKYKVDTIIDGLDLDVDGDNLGDEKRILLGNTIKAKLEYTVVDIYGEPRRNQINQGNFNIEAHLLTSVKVPSRDLGELPQEKYVKLNNNPLLLKTRFADEILISDPFDWEIPGESYNSKILLYLKVIPQHDTAKRVNRFEGIYYIGPKLQSIVSGNTKSLTLNTIIGEKYRKQISRNNKDTPEERLNQINYGTPTECFKALLRPNDLETCISKQALNEFKNSGYSKPGWTVDKMELRFFQMEKENWLSRHISTIVQTTVVDTLHDDNIRNIPIDITITDLTTGKINKIIGRHTEENGLIRFNIPTYQNWYKRQRYFLKIIRFQSQTGEMDVRKIVAINPWDYGFTHGFEVNHPTDIRTTCLDKKDKKLVFDLFKDPAVTEIEANKTIHKIFCHTPKVENTTINWTEIFKNFKTTLNTVLRQTDDSFNPEDHFYPKFTSAKKVTNSTSQIHLFRSINKYPTSLIDNSLLRDVYYNIRFKLSPRVVRYDDIARGQQNKGPIRDGVYVFQMAVLKNNQGRLDGIGNMVQHKQDFKQSTHGVKKAGVQPLFSCPISDPNCVTESDFIIPPSNIPVVVRDGIVRTDIRTQIKREHLLFSNSKNILVFRLLPSDPSTVVCKNKNVDCTMEYAGDYKTYEEAFDWKETIKNIKPARSDQYDMFFYTYKTPFIPTLWTNWNITHETENFSELEKTFEAISKNADKSVTITDIETLKGEKERLNSVKRNIDKITDLTGEILKITDLTKEIHKITETYSRLSDTIDISQKLALEEEPTVLPETSEVATPIELPEEILKNTEDQSYCSGVEINGIFYSTGASQQCSATTSVTNTKPQKKTVAKKDTNTSKQLLARHISNFASKNTLCTIDIHTTGPSVKQCGSFNNSENAQQSFVDDINKQIITLNESKKVIAELEENQGYLFEEIPLKETEDLLIDNTRNSVEFKNKLKGMPYLSTLSAHDLDQIIISGVDTSTVRDKKTGTFLHALCGFWFQDFLPKYVNSNLLLDGYKKAVTKTFYYQLKEAQLPEETENENIKNIRDDLSQMRVNYDRYLNQQKLKGQVDDLHKWANNKEGYGFNSKFVQNLRDDFEKRHEKSPLSSSAPSWKRNNSFYSILGGFFNEKNSEKEFRTTSYLEEASESLKFGAMPYGEIRRQVEDYHPVRKCLSNPSHFFGFEQISVVGKIGKNFEYNEGETTNLDLSEDFLMNAQRDQGANQQFEYKLDTSLALQIIPFAALALLIVGFPALGTFLTTALLAKTAKVGMVYLLLTNIMSTTTGMGYSYRGYEGTGKRKLLSIKGSENVRLISEHSSVKIPLEDYRECLVIRPRFSAFQSKEGKNYQHIWASNNRILQSLYKQAGMLLCTEGKEQKQITEDYYYVYPNYGINGITLDPSNHRNKPFAISLRGKKSYRQFVHNLNCDLAETYKDQQKGEKCRDTRGDYEYILSKNIEFADNLRKGFYTPKLFHLTGDIPGVYSRYIKQPDRDHTKASKKGKYGFFNLLNNWKPMDADLEKMLKKD